MEPYRHEDSDGDVLSISEREGKPGTALVKARGGAEVSAADLPEIVRALHEACGLPSPLILSRPETASGVRWVGDVYTGRLGSKVTIGRRVEQPDELDPDDALELAAAIAANAEAIRRGEPDAAEVDDLAGVIMQALNPGAMGLDGARPMARKLLATGRVRMVRDDV